MAENKDWKNPAEEYMHDIQVIYVLLVNEVFLGSFDARLVGLNCHT